MRPYFHTESLFGAALLGSFPGHIGQVKNPNDFFTGRCLHLVFMLLYPESLGLAIVSGVQTLKLL